MDEHFPNGMEISFVGDQGRQTLVYEKATWVIDGAEKGLRYGENPGQEAALYRLVNGNLVLGGVTLLAPGRHLASDIELLQSGKHPGKINITDADNALNILRYFSSTPCAVIVKHNNPCGVARGATLAEAYHKAHMADRLAAYGGAIALNREVDTETAELISRTYAEVVVAPEFAPGVMETFSRWKNLRIMKIARMAHLEEFVGAPYIDFKCLIDGGIVAQTAFVPKTQSVSDFLPAQASHKGTEYAIRRAPGAKELDDLLFGWLVETGVLSNSVIYVKDGATVGIGTGEQDRVWGAGLLISGLVFFQVAMSRGERDLWFQSTIISLCLVGALIMFALFVWWDSRPENVDPVLHLRTMWRQIPLRASFTVIMILGALMGGGLYVIPQYLRHVQDYNAQQTGFFIALYCGGLGLGLPFALRVLVPRWGGRTTILLGMLMVIATCFAFLYIWTPDTPATVLGPLLFLQGLSLAPVLVGASNVATSQAAVADIAEVDTTYFFVRQLGNTLGVTAATVIFDRRMTFHSSRLLDTANRLDPTVHSTLQQYAHVIAQRGGPLSKPALGALQLFQGQVIVQSELLSYIDVYYCLGAMCVIGLVLVIIARIQRARAIAQFHFW